MELAFTILLGIIAAGWVGLCLSVFLGMSHMPYIKKVPPARDDECPRISILFSARDEAEKMPRALEMFTALDYPDFEIIAVNDRSADDTGRILDEAAARDPRLKVIHNTELPPGWLGKPHGLQRAYEASTSDWLVFTDADVRFAPDLLRRAVATVQQRRLDHLTLLGQIDMHGFWETVVILQFAVAFTIFARTWKVSDPNSKSFCGVGSFQMVRRAAYEAAGTHRRLAMEVIDDMKLGKIVKEIGARSAVGLAKDSVAVRWHHGVGGMIRGTEKNFFAGADFKLSKVSVQMAGLIAVWILPFIALFFTSGWALAFAVIGVLAPISMEAGAAIEAWTSPLYALTYPVGVVIFAYMLARSTWRTLRQGGIFWRGTFYPLEQLRKGLV